MKFRTTSNRERGSVLVTTLVIALLVGLLVAALLFVAQQQNYLTARSRVWCSEIPIAEAGVEEAIMNIVSQSGYVRDDVNGWKQDGTNFWKSRTLTNGYFHTTIIPSPISPGDTNKLTNTIVSIGFARIPLQTTYSQRSVKAVITQKRSEWGFVAKSNIVLNGNTYADSYISTDPLWSTDGLYDPLKRRDHCGMATVASMINGIDTGPCKIYGTAATGPGGTVRGNVGDGLWLALNNGLQPGHVSDDFNMYIPDVIWPPTNGWDGWNSTTTPATNTDGKVYQYILDGNVHADYQFAGPSANPTGNGWLIKGNVRIRINGDFQSTLNGPTITLDTNATLQLYLNGDMSMGGQCMVNPTGLTGNFIIYGLNACKSIKFNAGAALYGRIYAPYAYVEIAGSFDYSGSVVSDRMKFSGTAALHYDEALDPGVPKFTVMSWEEL
jgi:Tfp pilus assembly protein PilX